jgi:hypothetical protein
MLDIVPISHVVVALAGFLVLYLVQLNRLLSSTPDDVRKLAPTRWTTRQLSQTYHRLEARPITTATYASRIPSRLDRRYIVTGGSGEFGQSFALFAISTLAMSEDPRWVRIHPWSVQTSLLGWIYVQKYIPSTYIRRIHVRSMYGVYTHVQ